MRAHDKHYIWFLETVLTMNGLTYSKENILATMAPTAASGTSGAALPAYTRDPETKRREQIGPDIADPQMDPRPLSSLGLLR